MKLAATIIAVMATFAAAEAASDGNLVGCQPGTYRCAGTTGWEVCNTRAVFVVSHPFNTQQTLHIKLPQKEISNKTTLHRTVELALPIPFASSLNLARAPTASPPNSNSPRCKVIHWPSYKRGGCEISFFLSSFHSHGTLSSRQGSFSASLPLVHSKF